MSEYTLNSELLESFQKMLLLISGVFIRHGNRIIEGPRILPRNKCGASSILHDKPDLKFPQPLRAKPKPSQAASGDRFCKSIRICQNSSIHKHESQIENTTKIRASSKKAIWKIALPDTTFSLPQFFKHVTYPHV